MAVLDLIPNQRIGWDTWLGLANANPGEGVKKPKDIQQPQHDGDDHHRIHDRLNGALHGDEAIYQPQKNSDDDQN
jgi:hypothetical protein